MYSPLKTTRVVTVYDSYGNPIPKIIDSVEVRPMSRASPSPQRVMSSYRRLDDEINVQEILEQEEFREEEIQVSPPPKRHIEDNKVLFQKTIEIKQSPTKSRVIDQSVDDDTEKLRIVMKAFKRLNKKIERSDKEYQTRTFIQLSERVHDVKARPLEERPWIKYIEITPSALNQQFNFKETSLHVIIVLESKRVDGKDLRLGMVHLDASDQILSSVKKDNRDLRKYQGLFKQLLDNKDGASYRNQVLVSGITKSANSKSWTQNQLTINYDEKFKSSTRTIDAFTQNLFYYALNRRLQGDKGEGMNTQPHIVANPVGRLLDIMLRRKFTTDD